MGLLKYVKPQIEVIEFELEPVMNSMTSSGNGNNVPAGRSGNSSKVDNDPMSFGNMYKGLDD